MSNGTVCYRRAFEHSRLGQCFYCRRVLRPQLHRQRSRRSRLKPFCFPANQVSSIDYDPSLCHFRNFQETKVCVLDHEGVRVAVDDIPSERVVGFLGGGQLGRMAALAAVIYRHCDAYLQHL